jgi:methyl-CpG-binding domain protein 4
MALTEYEIQRLAHIKRNMEYMASLGVLQTAAALGGACGAGAGGTGTAAKKRQKRPREAQEPTRRSGRLQNMPAERDGAEVDALSDEDEERVAVAGRGATDKEADARALLDHTREWLAASRAALARLGDGGNVPQSDVEWRGEAVRRWGKHVVKALPPGNDWKAFVSSRLTTTPPPSPLDLLQEYYCADGWRLIACCLLMSRVSSAKVKTVAIAAFFSACPTPSALIDAAPEQLQAIMHPLGLFENRMKSLVAISQRYLEMPVFDLGLDAATKVFGCGAFTVASFHIFCRGNLGVNPEDAALKAFVAWQCRQGGKAKGSAALKGE